MLLEVVKMSFNKMRRRKGNERELVTLFIEKEIK